MKDRELTVISIEIDQEMDFIEFIQASQITPEFFEELIAYGVFEIQSSNVNNWKFNMQHLNRVQRLVRLQQDLEVNLAGAALAIDLMDQIEELQSQLALFNSYLKKD